MTFFNELCSHKNTLAFPFDLFQMHVCSDNFGDHPVISAGAVMEFASR